MLFQFSSFKPLAIAPLVETTAHLLYASALRDTKNIGLYYGRDFAKHFWWLLRGIENIGNTNYADQTVRFGEDAFTYQQID